jgi:hypothetical protein
MTEDKSLSIDNDALQFSSDRNDALSIGPTSVIIDDFEYASRSGYEDAYDTGTYRYELTSSNVSHGSQAIYHTRNQHNEFVSMPSNGRLNYYPEIGDTLAVRMAVTGSGQWPYISFGHQGPDDDTRYRVELNSDDNNVEVSATYSNGHEQVLAASHNVVHNQYYEVICNTWFEGSDVGLEIEATNGSDQIGPVSTVDSEYAYSGDGVGFGGEGKTYHDYARVI